LIGVYIDLLFVNLSKNKCDILKGCDLSFRWVYVINLDPQGEAYKSGLVKKGDYIAAFGNISTVAQDFDFVLTTLAKYPEKEIPYTFYRGSKEKLVGGPVPLPSETTVTVTVKQSGKPTKYIECPGGTNLRQLLVGNGINVYRSLTR
jgi:S1-C subfamily serine protease